MTTVKDIVKQIENFSPPSLAEEWDPIGLSFGRYDQEVKRVLVALDIDPITLQEAIHVNADLIFTHHPLIFKATKTLNEEDPKRQLYIHLIREEMAVYSAHTNMDATVGGMNDWLAEELGLVQIAPMIASNDLEYPNAGLGRVGSFVQPLYFEDLLKLVDDQFNPQGMRYGKVGSVRKIQRVAILGGAGASNYKEALGAGAEVYLTGDITYHDGQDMLRDGLSFIDPGHFIEKIFIERMTEKLQEWNEKRNWQIEVLASQKQKDVFQFYSQ